MAIEILRRRPPADLLPSRAAEEIIEHFEGCVLYAYDDKEKKYPKTRITPANAHTVKGRLTIGFGRAVGVQPGDICTMDEAREWLREDIAKHAQIVRDTITVPLTQSEFDALTDLVYNIGYIPPSMKACLNGGLTDAGKQMAPGSYGSAGLQFPRNCRWGGIPHEEIYRRRLADACLFHDLPWQSACSKNLVKLELTPNNNIDPVMSTSLEDTLMRARQDIPDARPSPSAVFGKNWSDLTPPPKPEASVTVIEDVPELVLSEPAPPEPAPSVTQAKAEQPEAAPAHPPAVSAPVKEPAKTSPDAPVASKKPEIVDTKPADAVSPSANAGPAAVGPSSPPAPQSLPATLPAPVKTKPPPEPVIIAPKSVDVRSIPYGEIDVEKGAKNMTDSQRAMGMVIVGIGSVIQVVTTRLGVGTAIGAIAFDLSRDPVVIALGATAIAVLIGWLTRKRGTKIMTDGMKNATQVLK